MGRYIVDLFVFFCVIVAVGGCVSSLSGCATTAPATMVKADGGGEELLAPQRMVTVKSEGADYDVVIPKTDLSDLLAYAEQTGSTITIIEETTEWVPTGKDGNPLKDTLVEVEYTGEPMYKTTPPAPAARATPTKSNLETEKPWLFRQCTPMSQEATKLQIQEGRRTVVATLARLQMKERCESGRGLFNAGLPTERDMDGGSATKHADGQYCVTLTRSPSLTCLPELRL